MNTEFRAKKLLDRLHKSHYLRRVCQSIIAGKNRSNNAEKMVRTTYLFWFGRDK